MAVPLAITGLTGAAAAEPANTGTFVVVLRPGAGDVPGVARGLARAHDGALGFVYTHALRGFSVRLPVGAAAALARSPAVASVEAEQEYSVSAQSLPTGVQRVFAPTNPALDIDASDDARVDVDVAVLDTGIQLDHPDLNVAGSTNCVTFFATCGSGGGDGNGHGTHVAGTIGALDNGVGVVGVAPGARLWSVRVLGNNGTGTTSQIIAGMDWVTARAATIEVANLSLTGGASSAIDAAVNRMADAGIAVAVAAGNNDADAASYSPARASKVLTVSAAADYDGLPGALSTPPSSFCLDQDDTLWDSSNWGATIEIAAPGCRILSTYPPSGYAWINGTSMASPHVAGALALLASNGFPRTWTGVSGLYSSVVGAGNGDWTDDSGDGVREPLLDVHDPAIFSPTTIGSAPPPNQPPTSSFTYSCSDLACTFTGSGSDSDGTISSLAWTFGDGTSASGASASHTYPATGTYAVVLTATDDDGATGSSTQNVTVAAPIPNQPPTASFTYSCAGLACTFAGSGSDTDGTIASLTWSFGDGTGASGGSAAHTYAAPGTYPVTLTATDDDGAIGSATQSVTALGPVSVSLQGSATSSGSRWSASVLIAIAQNGAPVSRTVSWTWSNGASGSGTCSTSPCTVTKTGLKRGTTSVRLTVNSVGGSSTFVGQRSITVTAP